MDVLDKFAGSFSTTYTERIYAASLLGTCNMTCFFKDVLLLTQFLEGAREMLTGDSNRFRNSCLS